MMTRAPIKPSVDPTPTLRRLLRTYQLASIQITIGLHTISARAFPDTYHPVVAQRRDAAFAKAGGSVTLEEAQAISEKAMELIGFGRGDTLSELAASLEADLKRELKTRT